MSLPKTTESECEVCGGNCCKYHLSTYPKDNFIAEAFYKQRAERIIEYNDKFNIGVMYQPCPLFDEETGLCTDYKNRNDTCKEYPPTYVPEWAFLCEIMRNMHKKTKAGDFRILKV